MFTPEVQRRLDEIAALWNKVERHLKTAERIRLEVVVGAINELRYAGRLAVDAIAIAGNPDLAEQDKLTKLDQIITEIRNNCVRAHADITDALVLFFHKHLDMNVEDFSLSIVMTHFPQYTAMVAEIRTINLFMAESREDRHNRQDIYDRINEKHLPALADLYAAMNAISPKLIEEINARAAEQKNNTFFGKYGFYMGIGGIVLAVAGLYLGLAPTLHWWPFP